MGVKKYHQIKSYRPYLLVTEKKCCSGCNSLVCFPKLLAREALLWRDLSTHGLFPSDSLLLDPKRWNRASLCFPLCLGYTVFPSEKPGWMRARSGPWQSCPHEVLSPAFQHWARKSWGHPAFVASGFWGPFHPTSCILCGTGAVQISLRGTAFVTGGLCALVAPGLTSCSKWKC